MKLFGRGNAACRKKANILVGKKQLWVWSHISNWQTKNLCTLYHLFLWHSFATSVRKLYACLMHNKGFTSAFRGVADWENSISGISKTQVVIMGFNIELGPVLSAALTYPKELWVTKVQYVSKPHIFVSMHDGCKIIPFIVSAYYNRWSWVASKCLPKISIVRSHCTQNAGTITRWLLDIPHPTLS